MIPRDSIKIAGGIFAIGFVACFVYWGVLYPPAIEPLYPWASDTLGHVLKVDYLGDNLDQGISYPDILPDWYMGQQMMRYHPPLPYYLLVVLSAFLPSSVSAANWFIVLCAFVGGLSWLLYRRWIGLLPAILGGILFLFLPDNLRVAFAEGNLPRVLATAIMPVLVYFLLRSLEGSGSIWHRVGLALCFTLVVLSHAMMAAIFAIFCTLLVIMLWQ